MPKCLECGNETDLHELGIPTCPACIVDRGHRPSLSELRAELVSAREHYGKATQELGHSGGNFAPDIEAKVKMARERYREALKAYGDALQRDGR